MKTSAKIALGGGTLAVASLLAWRFAAPHKPYRVLTIKPTPCQLTGNCGPNDQRYQLFLVGRYVSLQDAATAAGVGSQARGCPGPSELRVVTGPQGSAGAEVTLAVVVPNQQGGCVGSFSMVQTAVEAAARNGLHLPPAAAYAAGHAAGQAATV
jgi:hypothetical protein